MKPTNRRNFLKGLGATGAACAMRSAHAFALPEDKIKAVHYFTTPGDAQGRQGQPMVQSVHQRGFDRDPARLNRDWRGRRVAHDG